VPPQTWYVSPYRDPDGRPVLTIWELTGGDYYRLLFADGTEFWVDRPGTAVWADWPGGLTPEDTATYLLSSVMGFVLGLRGTPCLHGSAVAVGGRAVALVGPSGAGKSTTAAALALRGLPVLADDLVVLRGRGEPFLVQPAYPRLRLWPASARLLCGEAPLPPLTPNWDKRFLDLTGNGCRFQDRPLPLGAVYLLDPRGTDPVAPCVEPLPAADGLIALVANTYLNHLPDRRLRARGFDLLGRVAARVPLRRVKPHADPDRLARLCDVILDDFGALSCPGAGTVPGEGERV
jgi:hypothetical protein